MPIARDRTIERLRGFYDAWIDDEARLLSVEDSLLRTLWLHGYRRVDVPVLEPAELFLRKTGAEITTKLYSFSDLGRREVTLRPEFTASVIRGAAERNLDGLLPLRLSYRGPVFRYERPQLGTSRQFTQVGVELLGAVGVATDVEVIQLACVATEACGVRDYRLVLGHLGMIDAFLRRLDLEEHVRQLIVANLEYYNRGPKEQAAFHARLGLNVDGLDEVEMLTEDGTAAGAADDGQRDEGEAPPSGGERGDNSTDAQQMLERVLSSLEFDLSSSTRTPEEIMARLVRKARRRDQSAEILQALAFVRNLGAIHGPPDRALEECAALLRETGLDEAPLDNLRGIVEGLERAGFDWSRGEIQFGMARGITYYTGMIFELYSTGPRPVQLCGGGRYDGLTRTLTSGPDIAALGFAFGLERLLLAVTKSGNGPIVEPTPVAVYTTDASEADIVKMASAALREAGIAAELDMTPRTSRSALARARRLGYDVAVFAGPTETSPRNSRHDGDADYKASSFDQDHVLTVHDLSQGTRHERVTVLALAEIVRQIRERKEQNSGT